MSLHVRTLDALVGECEEDVMPGLEYSSADDSDSDSDSDSDMDMGEVDPRDAMKV